MVEKDLGQNRVAFRLLLAVLVEGNADVVEAEIVVGGLGHHLGFLQVDLARAVVAEVLAVAPCVFHEAQAMLGFHLRIGVGCADGVEK